MLERATIAAYTHVIRELKGEPIVPAEEQIQRARETGGTSCGRRARECRCVTSAKWSGLQGWRDPDSNRGHHDFQAARCTTSSTRKHLQIGILLPPRLHVRSSWIRGDPGGLWTWRPDHVLSLCGRQRRVRLRRTLRTHRRYTPAAHRAHGAASSASSSARPPAVARRSAPPRASS